jgi:hypothetical protein
MSANDHQVGGTHYQSSVQHWDLVVMFQWDYFQAQITKYLMRWKFKHDTPEKKLQDLQKARHFLDKYIENYQAFLEPRHTEVRIDLVNDPSGRLPSVGPNQACLPPLSDRY